MHRQGFFAAVLFIAALFAPIAAAAQTSGGSVAGSIRDPQGGALPGVTLTVRNTDTGLTRTTVTEGDGRYRVSALPPGSYQIRAELQGFSPVDVKDVTLTVGLEFQRDLTLGLQGVQESVTVRGQAPTVETTKSEVAATVTAKQIDTLPIEGRSAITLSLLLPGTSTDATRAQRPGASVGGRQGLSEARRYPADYGGIVVGDAAHDVPYLYTGRMAVASTVHKSPQGEIPPARFPVMDAAVINACDALDGVKDGVIENPRSCRFDTQALACKGTGNANGDTCLAPEQVESVRALYAAVVDPRTETALYPGLEPGSELGWGALASPQPENNALDMFKYVVFHDAHWDWRTFDLARSLDAADRTPHIDAINAIDPDLRPFFSRGGKLLMYHGWADPQTPPQNSINYYDRVTATVGAKSAASSTQLFMVPGMGHCEGGDGTDTFDKVAALDAWVERGEAPNRIVASHLTNGRVDRTRPLCAYPQVARWTGRGSTNDAANFTCAAP